MPRRNLPSRSTLRTTRGTDGLVHISGRRGASVGAFESADAARTAVRNYGRGV